MVRPCWRVVAPRGCREFAPIVGVQGIFVAPTAAKRHGHEGDVLRRAFRSIALAGLFAMLRACVYPSTLLVP